MHAVDHDAAWLPGRGWCPCPANQARPSLPTLSLLICRQRAVALLGVGAAVAHPRTRLAVGIGDARAIDSSLADDGTRRVGGRLVTLL